MIDTAKIGMVAAELMGDIPDDAEGEIVGVAVVIIVDEGEATYTRFKSSLLRSFEQEGMFRAALRAVLEGRDPDEDD